MAQSGQLLVAEGKGGKKCARQVRLSLETWETLHLQMFCEQEG